MTVLGPENPEVGHTAQITPLVSNIAARGPGALKGRPRPPGSGRQPGTKNRRTVEVERAYHPIVRRMAKKLETRFNLEMQRGDKCNLDFAMKFFTLAAGYAYGRPVDRTQLTGAAGGPLTLSLVDFLRELPE